MRRPLRVAIACPGVGLSQRGFERMFHDLFRLMEGSLDITLFKGGGPVGEREKVPAFLPRNGRFVRMLPLHALLGRSPIHVECLTFALGLIPYLRAGDFDVVHCIDPPLARMLYKLRRLLGMRFRLLYTHGVTMPPSGYPPADHLHHVAQEANLEALGSGIPASSMTLVPCGFHPQRFDSSRSKAELRREYGVSAGTFVILSVAALNRVHKRSHHLIDEAARLEGDFLLWLDASMDQGEPDLVDYARARLGDRVRITHVASDKVGELYRMADVLAHASVWESFGLVIVEAASTGLPALCHDTPHFRWLLPNPKAWVDMSLPGALAERLALLMAHPELLPGITCREAVLQRFSWELLRPDYAKLYEHVASLAPVEGTGRGVNYFWQIHG